MDIVKVVLESTHLEHHFSKLVNLYVLRGRRIIFWNNRYYAHLHIKWKGDVQQIIYRETEEPFSIESANLEETNAN